MFESTVIHGHISFDFKAKLYPGQHIFVKSKSMATDLVIYFSDVLPPVRIWLYSGL
jgi:hypothetical protein